MNDTIVFGCDTLVSTFFDNFADPKYMRYGYLTLLLSPKDRDKYKIFANGIKQPLIVKPSAVFLTTYVSRGYLGQGWVNRRAKVFRKIVKNRQKTALSIAVSILAFFTDA